MNILYIGLNACKNMALPLELKKVADNFAEVNIGARMEEGIKEAARAVMPDLTFIHVQCAQIIPVELITYLKSFGKVMNWTGDVRQPIPFWYEQMSSVDITLFSNWYDVHLFRKNYKADFLQIGYDEKIFRPKEIVKDIDVVFMANNYAQFPNSKHREQLAKDLFRNHKAKIYGFGWNGIAAGNLNSYWQQEADIYHRAKIAINYSNFTREGYTSDRMHRILGCGTFCLSHYFKGVEEYQVETFMNDLDEKINYYLTHDDEREQKARQGYEFIRNNMTYAHMVKNILKIYESL